MTTSLSAADLKRISQKITDRRNVFYWQTDRIITPEETGAIWADRHRYFTDAELMKKINAALKGAQLVNLVPFDPNAQTNLGNVNSVRAGLLDSGQEVIIRCHPKGVKNGYFYAEALASQTALDAGLPGFRTLLVHELEDPEDLSFQVCQKLPGDTVKFWLDAHPEDEDKLLLNIGKNLGRLHKIKVNGFGPFDNEEAKNGKLIGLHPTFAKAVRAGLDFNLKTLVERGILTLKQAKAAEKLFDENPSLNCEQAVLIHNDFADWNLLTDGRKITGFLDWDECVGGDPVAEIGCWSTFFEPERLDGMLEGYWSVAKKPADFEEKFQLLRLRYTLSKMTLRLRRYDWMPTEEVRQRIEIGKKHLTTSLTHFGID